ncbi:hypothetical protein ACFXAM_30335, partial [Kitasatospora sp. NPDC059462]
MKKPAFRKKPAAPGAAPAGAFDGAPAPKGSSVARTTRSLLAAGVVLAAVFGIAELRPPAAPARTDRATATTAQVERSTAVCPQPLQGLTGSTTLTAYTPPGAGEATGGAGWLSDAAAPAAAPAAPAPG